MTAELLYRPQDVGANISRTVRSLVEWHEVSLPDLFRVTGIRDSTYYRRMKSGAWTSREAALLAAYFGIQDIDQLFAGDVRPRDTDVSEDTMSACARLLSRLDLPDLHVLPSMAA